MRSIIKRNGNVVAYDSTKIANAMKAAFTASEELPLTGEDLLQVCMGYATAISVVLDGKYSDPIHIEIIQNEVENFLMGIHPETAKAYILYRKNRESQRERHSKLMDTYDDIVNSDAADSDLKRENANIDGNTAMGSMLKFGSEGAKAYYKEFVLSDDVRNAHEAGDIHIHDLDFLTLTTTCTQIDIKSLFEGGFSTGEGFLREPASIRAAAALAAIAIQANQNDQHGGQSIPNFDYAMAVAVKKTLKTHLRDMLVLGLKFYYSVHVEDADMRAFLADRDVTLANLHSDKYISSLTSAISEEISADNNDELDRCVRTAIESAVKHTEKETHQAMEAFVHNLNTMHSRAGEHIAA